MPAAEVYISKEAAAQRQIDAAVRMLFSDEDELAIHTVAAAAYRVVRDLREKRGHPEIPKEAEAVGYFFLAKAIAEDRAHSVPQALRDLANADPQIRKLVDHLRKLRKEGHSIEPTDFAMSTFGSNERAHWAKMSQVANFLKHADRDDQRFLQLSKMSNEELLMGACTSFVHLTKKLTPEMNLFMLKAWADDPKEGSSGLQGMDAAIVKSLQSIKPEMRKRACLEILPILKGEAPVGHGDV